MENSVPRITEPLTIEQNFIQTPLSDSMGTKLPTYHLTNQVQLANEEDYFIHSFPTYSTDNSPNRPIVSTPELCLPTVSPPRQIIVQSYMSERQKRLERYKTKKLRRLNHKRILYDCRKKVADTRLRVKGRFVTKDQAYKILGLSLQQLNESINNASVDSICTNLKIKNIESLISGSS